MEDGGNGSSTLLLGAAGLVISAIGLIFAGLQSKSAARAIEISNSHAFVSQTYLLWKECIEIIGLEPFDQDRFNLCLANILGQFEIAVISILERFSTGRRSQFVEETIVNYLDKMAEEGYSPYTRGMIIQNSDCKHLKDFCKQRAIRFSNPKLVFDMLNIE